MLEPSSAAFNGTSVIAVGSSVDLMTVTNPTRCFRAPTHAVLFESKQSEDECTQFSASSALSQRNADCSGNSRLERRDSDQSPD